MRAVKNRSYNNLIDFCINCEENPEMAGKPREIFRVLLSECFFSEEASQSKSFQRILEGVELPSFLDEKPSILKVDVDELEQWINGDILADSLCGKLMFSKEYLNAFYHDHPPSFSKLPDGVREALAAEAKVRNAAIIEAFRKIEHDIEADRKRKVINLVALIIKNVQLRSGHPAINPAEPASKIISTIFKTSDEVFTAKHSQMSELADDTRIKSLIKSFFRIRMFSEINDLTRLYHKELDRYKKRAVRAST